MSSMLLLPQERHRMIVLLLVRNEAHQKHDLHIKKFFLHTILFSFS